MSGRHSTRFRLLRLEVSTLEILYTLREGLRPKIIEPTEISIRLREFMCRHRIFTNTRRAPKLTTVKRIKLRYIFHLFRRLFHWILTVLCGFVAGIEDRIEEIESTVWLEIHTRCLSLRTLQILFSLTPILYNFRTILNLIFVVLVFHFFFHIIYHNWLWQLLAFSFLLVIIEGCLEWGGVVEPTSVKISDYLHGGAHTSTTN